MGLTLQALPTLHTAFPLLIERINAQKEDERIDCVTEGRLRTPLVLVDVATQPYVPRRLSNPADTFGQSESTSCI